MALCDEERGVPSLETKVDDVDEDIDYAASIKDTKYSWVVCFAGFMLQVIIVGFLHVFGIFFVYFVEEFQTTKAKTAWLGSIAYGLNMAFGCLTGLVEARIGTRPVLMIGSTICTISLVVSSFAPSIEVLFGTFSVIYGIGSSMAYTPTMCLSQVYFDKYMSLSTGIMVAGSSTGTLILSPIAQALLKSLGWRNSFRVFAAFTFTTVFFGALVKPVPITKANKRQQHSQAKQFLAELKIWKNRVFILWTIALAMSFFGYFIIGVHLVSHAEDIGIPPEKGATLLIFLGGSIAVGRVMWGKIVQWRILNRVNLHQASMIITGTLYMMLPSIKSYGGLIAYCIVHGLVDGCYVVLLPIVTSKLVGSEKAAVAWGFLVGVCSLTFMTGPPVAGLISDATGSYDLAFHVAAIPLMIAALLLFLLPWAQRTARGTNSMHEIRDYAPTFPEVLSSSDEEDLGSRHLLHEDDFEFIDGKDAPSARSVHFADMAGSRWRSTGQIAVKKNRSMELEGCAERPRPEGHRGRRRCISESVETTFDRETLDCMKLKPIQEQSAVKQKAVGSNAAVPPSQKETGEEKDSATKLSQEKTDDDTFQSAVRSALIELESNELAMAHSISENESHENPDSAYECLHPITSWEGKESLFSPPHVT